MENQSDLLPNYEIIPDFVLYNKNINSDAKLIMAIKMGNDRVPFANTDLISISESINISKTNADKAIRQLMKEGYI